MEQQSVWRRAVGIDVVVSLVELLLGDSQELDANAERLAITFQEADAEALPFADNSFDLVLSTFGVMFTPNQEKAASELLRVCRPSGNKTPTEV